jgi:hypothetical protein
MKRPACHSARLPRKAALNALAAFGHGVGEKKLNEFGEIFTKEITTYLENNPKREFA